VERATGRISESRVAELASWLTAGDLLVANDSRVFPARLRGRRRGGGRAECLLLEELADGTWWALVNPGQRLPVGATITCDDDERAPGVDLRVDIVDRDDRGRRRVRLVSEALSAADAVERLGHIPLPPYIKRDDTAEDRERYQTLFAQERGSIAAPTAGLHFDPPLLARLTEAGVQRTTVTLHVGYGTFKPVTVDDIREHQVDAERWHVSAQASAAMQAARASGRRVVAVGTTTTRALESASVETGHVAPGGGSTRLCILPGHRFRAVDALMTNFHLPKSSLLLLVSAFAGRDLVLEAYREAVRREFHFYSYGDAMLIL
jgi:S-adenosylmethionine:tRNA ribosyltransferase-isomerase